MLKRETIRIYRVLSAIRRGIYWQSLEEVMKLKHETNIRDLMKNIQRLQESSNNFLSLFIFSTSLLIALLQLFQAIFSKLPPRLSVITILFYIICMIIIAVKYRHEQKNLIIEMEISESSIKSNIENLENKIHLAGINDDIITYLSEVKMLVELKEEYKILFEKGKISLDNYQDEIDNIDETCMGIGNKINKLTDELKNFVGDDH